MTGALNDDREEAAIVDHGWGCSFNPANDDEIQEAVGATGFERRILITELSYQRDWSIR